MVDLYRLIYRLFLAEADISAKGVELVKEVFYNRFPEIPVETDEVIARFGGLIKLFRELIEKSGLSITEFFGLIIPVNPESAKIVCLWWGELLHLE